MVKKTKDDFNDLKEASMEILTSQGCESNHDEVLNAIRNDQLDKAYELLFEVARVMNDFLKTANQRELDCEGRSKAKELIGSVNSFLGESVASCNKTFGKFNESDFLREVRSNLSSFQKA